MKKEYEYIVVGAGICGCSVAYELSKHSNDILLVDKLDNIASGASGAAGAFLSPLLGKPNKFKDLVTKSLIYTTKLYQKAFPNVISNCGTTRVPQNEADREKFKTYEESMDFPYSNDNDGYHFKVGTVVNSYGICKMMTISFYNKQEASISTLFNYKVTDTKYDGEYWHINDDLKAKHLILTTGAKMDLLKDESYLQIRPVWGYRVDVETTTSVPYNYHKKCSVSKSFPLRNGNFRVSIGATHHREFEDVLKGEQNSETLIQRAKDILNLEDVKVTKEFLGARACSVDYFPMVGEIIDSKKTLEEFPYLVNGTHVQKERFSRYKNLYILNGIGGRGFVMAPYLAKQLVENIIKNKPMDEEITVDRLFLREVKRGNIDG